MAADALTGADLQSFRTGAQLVAAVCNVGLNLLLIPLFGIMGAVIATVVSEALLAGLFRAYISFKRAPERSAQ
ncbi:hypothetical protein E3O11_10070 [Cryobacterium levicorallinum]|uniref:Uncharacterized protein n=1 Tax=Cryobacterium levicorallinum TaxID=995038 RepID=A0A4R8VKZ3_9MICO|nr:hypothetical protein E3O11_10070 [Cryobacterium levicorallinum]